MKQLAMNSKLLTTFILSLFLLTNTTFAFRDVTERSPIYEPVNDLIERGVMEDGAFFRASDYIPLGYFWQLVLNDDGFDPTSVNEDLPLPPNISYTDPLAPYLRKLISDGELGKDKNFNKDASIRRIEAIKILIKTKNIVEPRHVSKSFREIVKGVSPIAKYLNSAEAAYASQILENKDIDELRPYEFVTREELVRWLYNWHKNGEKKISSLGEPKKDDSIYPQYPYEKRLNRTKRTSKEKTEKAKILIESLFGGTPQNQETAVLNEVLNQINKKFKFQEKLDDKKKEDMINEAIVKMVETLDDKYSVYVEPEKVKEFTDSLTGNFEGIGAYVEMIDNLFTITAPIKGSPAEKAGINAGDIVTKVDDVDVGDLSVAEIIDKIKGPAGTKVVLSIKRNEAVQEITVTRGKITIPALKLEWKNGIPIVGMHQFSKNTGAQLERMLKKEILPKEPKGIIFDLRNNPGGFLTAAVNVGGIFLEKNTKIFSAEYIDNKEVFTAKKDGILSQYDKPMVFLQNKGSASASEILTSIIKDYKIGTIIGTNSFGKGTVQEIIQFVNGGSLKLTVAKWISPKGNWINEIGVAPDTEVTDPTDEEKKNKADRQMEVAMRIVLGKK